MTREEANITIDYLKEMQEGYIEGEGYERHPLPEWYALDKAIQTIEQTTWIPVSKRLPEMGDHILCSIANHYSKHKIIISQYNREDCWSNGIIEAWMPLPEPYKESEG